MTFDPARWSDNVWVHPTRDQLEEACTKTAPFLQLKRKLHLRVESAKFAPERGYHATVVVDGVRPGWEGLSMMTATRVFCDSPIHFSTALSYTFHVKYGGRPLIGLICGEQPLDRDFALAHFVARGDEGR